MIKEDNKYINGNYIPKVYTTTTDASGNSKTVDSTDNNTLKWKCDGKKWESEECTSMQKILEAWGGAYSPLLIYAYQVFRLQDYKSIDGTLNQIKTWGQLLNQLFVGAIMFLVFGLLVMALIAMLLLRAIKLWMYAIFSPLFTLHFVAGKELFGKSTEGFDLKEFIGLCFVPAVVWLTLSFGLMIVSVVGDSGSKSKPCSSIEITNLEKGTGGCPILTLFGNANNTVIRGVYSEKESPDKKYSVTIIKMAWLTHIYKWSATNANTVTSDANSIKLWLDAGGGIFWTIIVNIIALIFIWMAFMAGKWISKAVDAAVQPFEDMWKKVGSMAASIPKYTPIPGLGMSASGMQQVMSKLETNIDQKQREKLADTPLWKLVWMDSKLARAYSELEAQAKKEKVSMIELESARKAATEIIASKWLWSKEGQNAMDKLKQVAMKNDTLSTQIKNAKLYSTDWSITLAWEQLLEWNLKSTSWWSNQTLANDEVVKKWKSKQENYNGPTWGANWGISGNSSVNINIASNNNANEYSLGDKLKWYKDKNQFIQAIKENIDAIKEVKTEDIEAALKAHPAFKDKADEIINELKKTRKET